MDHLTLDRHHMPAFDTLLPGTLSALIAAPSQYPTPAPFSDQPVSIIPNGGKSWWTLPTDLFLPTSVGPKNFIPEFLSTWVHAVSTATNIGTTGNTKTCWVNNSIGILHSGTVGDTSALPHHKHLPHTPHIHNHNHSQRTCTPFTGTPLTPTKKATYHIQAEGDIQPQTGTTISHSNWPSVNTAYIVEAEKEGTMWACSVVRPRPYHLHPHLKLQLHPPPITPAASSSSRRAG